MSNFRRSSQAWKNGIKHWTYKCTFVAFLNIHSLLFSFHLGCNYRHNRTPSGKKMVTGVHVVSVPDPKPTPARIAFSIARGGRKSPVDRSAHPLLLIQTCWNYQNFTRGQEAVGDKCQHGRLVYLFAAVPWTIRAIVGVWILHQWWMLDSASFSKC